MAAPSNVYSVKGMFIGAPLNNQRIALALPLSAYVDKATFLSLFYLDDTEIVRDPSTGENCLIGMCVQGSTNDAMHNPNRVSRRRNTLNGATRRLFNDAGLNTLGKALSFSAISNLGVNGITIISAQFKSAYYVDSHIAGFNFRVTNRITTWQNGVLSGVARNTLHTETNRPYDIGQANIVLRAGDRIEIEPYMQNDEGTHKMAVIYVTVTAIQLRLRVGSSPQNAFNSTTIIIKEAAVAQLDIGVVLYDNFAQGIYAAPGYYMDELDANWYQVTGSSGVITAKGYYIPPFPVYKMYAAEWTSDPNENINQLAQVVANWDQVMITIYQNNTTQLWYFNFSETTGAFTNLVTGTFLVSTDATTYTYFRIINGVEAESGQRPKP